MALSSRIVSLISAISLQSSSYFSDIDSEVSFLRTEISEMEEFARSHSSSEPFAASDSLKSALREWALALTNRWRADKLVQEYKQRLMNVMSGNVFVEHAEKSLRKTPSFVPGWLILDEDKSKIDEWYNQRTETWQAGKWFEHLELSRKLYGAEN